MTVTFAFFDRKFNNEHDYLWECELECIPRQGDEVSLPGLDGGGPLRHGDKWFACVAVIEGVTWYLAESGEEEHEVQLYCRILWNESCPEPAWTQAAPTATHVK